MKGAARDVRNIQLFENIRRLLIGITPSRTRSLKHSGHRLCSQRTYTLGGRTA